MTILDERLNPSRNPPVLSTERVEDYERLRAEIIAELDPQSTIEMFFVDDVVDASWEIQRLRPLKTQLIKIAIPVGLKKLCNDLSEKYFEIKDVAKWFSDEKGKATIMRLLAHYQLDERTIEAQAMRTCFSDLEAVDRRLATLASRRQKAIRSLDELRSATAGRARPVNGRVVNFIAANPAGKQTDEA